jgi:CheY-like chemotaxis protein
MKRDRSAIPATVLLVEDNPSAKDATKLQLESIGCTVLTAENGPQSLEILRSAAQRIDLILSDVVMPNGMNGQELAQEAVTLMPELKVILISGYPKEELISSGKILDSVPLLAKPFDRDNLRVMIQEVLAGQTPG